MANGCVSFWVVAPKRKLVSVTEGNLTTHYGTADAISCTVSPGQIPVAEIFGPVTTE